MTTHDLNGYPGYGICRRLAAYTRTTRLGPGDHHKKATTRPAISISFAGLSHPSLATPHIISY